MVDRGVRAVTVFLENKVKTASIKIKIFKESNITRHQNKLFENNPSFLYKELGDANKHSNKVPEAGETKEFWNNIWAQKSDFNREATWLSDFENSYNMQNIVPQGDVTIDDGDVKSGLKRMANWKAPGPDGVRGFWFKKLSSVHCLIVKALQRCITEGDVPGWMTKGRTVLIQKDPAKGTVASNYRPIACLLLMWKLLTGSLAGKTYDHLESNCLLPDDQKGCRKGSKGTKDQLLIDKAVLREVKLKHRFLSMAWLDYRKAYDMVPHPWILRMMEVTKIAGNVTSFLSNTMKHWKSTLM